MSGDALCASCLPQPASQPMHTAGTHLRRVAIVPASSEPAPSNAFATAPRAISSSCCYARYCCSLCPAPAAFRRCCCQTASGAAAVRCRSLPPRPESPLELERLMCPPCSAYCAAAAATGDAVAWSRARASQRCALPHGLCSAAAQNRPCYGSRWPQGLLLCCRPAGNLSVRVLSTRDRLLSTAGSGTSTLLFIYH